MNMAENIVRWWKHKILGGYKQFSVQDNPNDYEQLMSQHARASSSCSAPPDLLLLNDRDINLSIGSSDTKPDKTTLLTISNEPSYDLPSKRCILSDGSHGYINKPSPQLSRNNKSSKQSYTIFNSNNRYNSNNQQNSYKWTERKECQQYHEMEDVVDDITQKNKSRYQENRKDNHYMDDEERIRLEEFSCNVSVKRDGKSSQPLQFSFTFYDLDGHHGKITKDDIVGIVYTIYEAIGKSVVVPHCGSKTINVRLTLSPEGKSKSKMKTKLKSKSCRDNKNSSSSSSDESGVARLKSSHRIILSDKEKKNGHLSNRRKHRYKPRKLIKSDDDDEEENEDEDCNNIDHNKKTQIFMKNGISKHAFNKVKYISQKQREKNLEQLTVNDKCHIDSQQYYSSTNNKNICFNDMQCTNDNLEVLNNVKEKKLKETCTECTTIAEAVKCVGNLPSEMRTLRNYHADQQTYAEGGIQLQCEVLSPLKPLKKYHKQKNCGQTRPRSLSAGNNSHLKEHRLRQKQQQTFPNDIPLIKNKSTNAVDHVQLCSIKSTNMTSLRTPPPKLNSMECWKTSFNRNELISIIRKSMEKNRLCFQNNRKPYTNENILPQNKLVQSVQYNGNYKTSSKNINESNSNIQQQSPIIQSIKTRRRSGTISKIPTLIANHNNSLISNVQLYSRDIKSKPYQSNDHNFKQSNVASVLIPHIGSDQKYSQISNGSVGSSAVNVGNHNTKVNLCSYDSFLHATICRNDNIYKLPMNRTVDEFICSSYEQPIAAVKPIISPVYHKTYNSVTQIPRNNNKTNRSVNKLLNNNNQSYINQMNLNGLATDQNTPQHHGYQRLSSTTKHNLAALNLLSPNIEKADYQYLEKCRKRGQLKNYDQLLYAKLSEKLHQTKLIEQSVEQQTDTKETVQTKEPLNYLGDAIKMQNSDNTKDCDSTIKINTQQNDFITVTTNDPFECEYLISQTSDEESSAQSEINYTYTLDKCINTATKCQSHVPRILKTTQMTIPSIKPHEYAKDEENNENAGEENVRGDDDKADISKNSAVAASSESTCNKMSSLTHRYVHEHIHHHYHHFDDKEP